MSKFNPDLNAELETRILRIINGEGNTSRNYDEIIEKCEPLIMAVLKKYFASVRPAEVEGFIQASRISIFKSIDAFDFTKGVKFTTYAITNLIQSNKNYIRDVQSLNSQVRLPAHKMEMMNSIRNKENKFRLTFNREANIDDLDISKEEYDEYKRYININVREKLFKYGDEDGVMVINDKAPTIKDEYDLGCNKEFCFLLDELEYAFEELTEKEKSILTEIYVYKNTYADVGEMYGVSKQRIQQLERKACVKIKNKLNEDFLKEYNLI